MDSQNSSNSGSKFTGDYLAPDIGELSRQRGGSQNDPLNRGQVKQTNTMTRAVARRLLPASVAAPGALWWLLYFGQLQGWYDTQTCFTLFVFSIAAVFGLIVCLNLKRLSRMDAERAAAEEQLKLARDAAEAANRFKSAFFANISHEIRTPLTAINGFAELILNPNRTNKERLADAQVIRRNGEHLLTLINDILDLSKIEAGRMTVDRIGCCPAKLVGDVCSMFRHRTSEKGIEVAVAFEGPIPTCVRTDPTRVRQILINLIANAIKFTKEGGVSVTVSVTPSIADPRPLLSIRIADTGIGIPEEQIKTLFQPFVQGDASITRQYGGTGLGLAISQHFARALGGDVTVSSTVGKGSTFVITLETDSLVGISLHDNPEQALDIEDAFGGPQVRIKGSILVAEDGIDNQALIAARLRQTGLKVEIAANGQLACDKALAALQVQKPFDLILMDVQMPVMDGYTATLNLRGKGYRGPIIALTANAMERDRDKCLNAGCNDFVTKPIQLEKLFKAMGRYLTVEQISEETPAVNEATEATRGNPLEEFWQKLPAQLAQLDEAVTRQDRVRLKEVVQLILGKSAAVGLKELASEAARLFQSAQSESSWSTIGQEVKEFTRTAQPKPDRQAA